MIPGDPALPKTIGEFAILRELGRGGMGVVYEAVQGDAGRRVALKVVRGGQFVDDAELRLFRREVQALARLEHPGIASLYASGRTHDGLHYFAMELVLGTPLDDWLRERGATPSADELRARLALFLDIADAVAYAHQRGVIHRDLKPSNLVVTAEGGVKVLDFGLARITDVDVARATQVTEVGTLRGTVAYMSPEQLAGRPEALDVRADVYALGVVLHELIVGEHPFDLERVPAFDIPRMIRDEPPRSLKSLWKGRARLDPDLATIVAKALEKDPVRRYASVSALADDLRRFLVGQPILARAPSAFYQIRKLVARHKVPFAALVAVVLLLAAFGASMAVIARRLADERNRANREAERAGEEARAAQQAAKVLSELVHVDLVEGLFDTRKFDPAEVARVVASIEARWPNRPAAAAELLDNVGSSLAAANAYEPAIRFLERAVAIRRDVLHDPSWETGGRRIFLGEYYAIAGRLHDAEAVFASALARARVQPDAPPNVVGYILENLGCVRRDLGRYDEGEALIRQALTQYESQQPVWPPYLASAHDSLGTLFLARGELEAAETEMREALRLREDYSKDMNWIRARYMLGLILVRRGKSAEAEAMLEEALSRRVALNGPKSADAAPVFDALGELFLAEGKLDRADEALSRSLAAFEASLPPNNPARATALVHTAELRRRQGRMAEARDALTRAATIRQGVLGPDHPETRRAVAALAAFGPG